MKPVCLVFGAGAGIGGTVAAKFAEEGYHSFLCRRSDKAGLDTVVIYNAGPDIESQLQTLFSEGIYGFLFAVGGVFIFLLNIKPGLMKGLAL